MGILLRRMHRSGEAVEYYQQALEVAPADQNLYFNLARVMFEIEKKDEAVVYLRKALQIAPDFTEAKNLLAK